jgi:hypothetical protein
MRSKDFLRAKDMKRLCMLDGSAKSIDGRPGSHDKSQDIAQTRI